MSNREKQWTPGPWRRERARGADEYQIVGDGWGITNVAPLLRAGGCSEGEANARLIAAAPDLVEALEMVLDDPSALDGRPRTADVVFEALAKAYGEPNE